MQDFHNTIAWLLTNDNVAPTFTASAVQSQGNGLLATYGLTIVTTVGTDGDAVTLPTAETGRYVTIFNADGSQHLELWANTSDAIDGGSVNGSIIVGPQQRVSLVAKDATNWITLFHTNGVSDSLVAFAGGGQGSATQMSTDIVRVSTVATNGDSIKLPVAAVGLMVAVYNDDTAQYCECFPGSGDRINDLSIDAGIIISANTGVIFYCVTNGLWHTFARDLPTVAAFVASATQTQGNGIVSNGYTRITPVVTDGDAITLPVPYIGNECTLLNSDAGQYAQVFPSSGADITLGTLALGTDNPMLLFPGQSVKLRAINTTSWHGATPTPDGTAFLTAFAGGGQLSATLLIADVNIVNVVATAGDSVKLPQAALSIERWVYNDGSNALDLFPNTSDSINGLAVDTAISVAPESGVILKAISPTVWKTF